MRLLNIIFILFLLIFILFEALKLNGVTFPVWTTSYLNDFLCMPIILTICLKTVHYLTKDRLIKISIAQALTLTFFYAIYFELILPQFVDRYTADLIDVLLYFIGAILFLFLQTSDDLKQKTLP
ncbi:hypothetical protein [Christiangramia sp. OXR-203]|uniref:hypothetical protein n=1 Tax=Christiangramia sp. OXR-203 TaxID=3100176 RepID=UPI002AC92A42|nr:hypothetical protein [Christiangramia sp. OXR-203]WPY99386.1 hypothetical protein T8I65_04060 [Christiangramia sp. OXR-203]